MHVLQWFDGEPEDGDEEKGDKPEEGTEGEER